MLLPQFPQHTMRFVHCKRTDNLWLAIPLNIIKLKRVGATEGVSLERPQVNKNGPSIPRQLEKVEKKTLGEKPIGSVSCGQKNANWHKIAIYPFFLLSTSMFWGREDRLSRCEDILKALSCSSRASAAVAPGRTDRRRRTNRSNEEGSNSLWQSVLRATLRGGERWIATNEAKVDPSRLDFLA